MSAPSKFARAFAAAHVVTNLTGDEAAVLRGAPLPAGSDGFARVDAACKGLERKGLIGFFPGNSDIITRAGREVLRVGELILDCRGELFSGQGEAA